MKERKANSSDPLTALNASFHDGSPIHLPVDRLQSQSKSLVSRLEPVLAPLPPYPSLSVWPISRNDCLSASSPLGRLGRSTLLASGSPPPDRPEHSMAASWHKSTHRALIQTNTSYFMRVSQRAGSQSGNRMFLTCFIMYQRQGLKPKSRAKGPGNNEHNATLSAERLSL